MLVVGTRDGDVGRAAGAGFETDGELEAVPDGALTATSGVASEVADAVAVAVRFGGAEVTAVAVGFGGASATLTPGSLGAVAGCLMSSQARTHTIAKSATMVTLSQVRRGVGVGAGAGKALKVGPTDAAVSSCVTRRAGD